MKHKITGLAVAVATFLLGVASSWPFHVKHAELPAPQSELIRVDVADKKESRAKPTSTPAPIFFAYEPTEFNPRGDYFILGPKPKGFRDFDCLELAIDDTHGRISGNIMVQTYVNQTYDALYNVSGVITKKWIAWTAKPVFEEDVGYSFEGEFLREGVLSRAGKYQAVLKGRLKKFKGGEKIAEASVRFRIEYLGC